MNSPDSPRTKEARVRDAKNMYDGYLVMQRHFDLLMGDVWRPVLHQQTPQRPTTTENQQQVGVGYNYQSGQANATWTNTRKEEK